MLATEFQLRGIARYRVPVGHASRVTAVRLLSCPRTSKPSEVLLIGARWKQACTTMLTHSKSPPQTLRRLGQVSKGSRGSDRPTISAGCDNERPTPAFLTFVAASSRSRFKERSFPCCAAKSVALSTVPFTFLSTSPSYCVLTNSKYATLPLFASAGKRDPRGASAKRNA
eukprot:1244192-Pyramimonas_sp.AAC.1